MSTSNGTKINQLLSSVPPGIVLQSSWLVENGYSHDLQQRYRKSKWLTSIGKGALIRNGDKVGYEGGVYALQNQTKLSLHPAGKTALALLGKSHYLELGQTNVILFSTRDEKLPVWFQKHDWGARVKIYKSSFLPGDLGLTEYQINNFSVKISGLARAMMECLYLAPEKQDIIECYELMEGLNNLLPKHVQALLENCSSIKVKRLFFYLAEKAGHSWLKHIKTDNIDLGKGKRSIVKNGVLVEKYGITVPKELEKHERDI